MLERPLNLIRRFVRGDFSAVIYWLVGLPGTILLFVFSSWLWVTLSLYAHDYSHLFPEILIVAAKPTLLAIGLSVIIGPPVIGFYFALYIGSARAAERATGWVSRFLWMGIGGHAAISILGLLFIVTALAFRL